MADMDNEINRTTWIVIYGITSDGVKFRPSSWAEMLIEGVGLTSFGRDHKIHYTRHIWTILTNGNAGIIMNGWFKHEQPIAFAEIMRFANNNRLTVNTYNDTIALL